MAHTTIKMFARGQKPSMYSVLQLRRLFIPINEDNLHWVLVAVSMDERNIEGFNSFPSNSKMAHHVDFVLHWLEDEVRNNIGTSLNVADC